MINILYPVIGAKNVYDTKNPIKEIFSDTKNNVYSRNFINRDDEILTTQGDLHDFESHDKKKYYEYLINLRLKSDLLRRSIIITRYLSLIPDPYISETKFRKYKIFPKLIPHKLHYRYKELSLVKDDYIDKYNSFLKSIKIDKINESENEKINTKLAENIVLAGEESKLEELVNTGKNLIYHYKWNDITKKEYQQPFDNYGIIWKKVVDMLYLPIDDPVLKVEKDKTKPKKYTQDFERDSNGRAYSEHITVYKIKNFKQMIDMHLLNKRTFKSSEIEDYVKFEQQKKTVNKKILEPDDWIDFNKSSYSEIETEYNKTKNVYVSSMDEIGIFGKYFDEYFKQYNISELRHVLMTELHRQILDGNIVYKQIEKIFSNYAWINIQKNPNLSDWI